jgi:GMP synthase (glutamine-hydrolysing)
VTLLAITHLPRREHGLFDTGALPTARLHIDDAWRPRLNELDGVLVFGGAMGVPDAASYPFLRWELELLTEALEHEVPVLGLCLGAQLLATAAGGHVRRMERSWIGWPELVARPGAAGDRLFGALPRRLPVFEYHEDAIEPPPRATVLAETAGPGCSVFRGGPAAWGSQIHLELTPEMLAGWAGDPTLGPSLAAGGYDPAEAPRRLAPQMAAGRAVLERFVALVGERATTRSGSPRPRAREVAGRGARGTSRSASAG